MSLVGGGLGGVGSDEGRSAAVAWYILPRGDTPFFSRRIVGGVNNRATSGVSGWMAGGVDSGHVGANM